MIKCQNLCRDFKIYKKQPGLKGALHFALTPVPGGAGSMTIASLLENCFLLFQQENGS